MPLPLPSLDTRRWSDLVAEGRALVPRYAPTWTDHNVHDPGIMLMELFAWLSEQLVYRANRVPERHLRKFLALAGFTPHPPLPALAVLGATLPPASGTLAVPTGLLIQADAASANAMTFRVTQSVTLSQATLVTVQGYDGTRFSDLTRAWRDGVPLAPLGVDPRPPKPYAADRAPALYLGFDVPIAVGDELSLFVWVDGSGFAVRRRLMDESREQAEDCHPPRDCPPCEPRWPCADENSGTSTPAALPSSRTSEKTVREHHSVRVEWEIATAGGWESVSAQGSVLDQTRGLTIDGSVRLTIAGVMVAQTLGAVSAARFYLRCRLVAGRFDATPTFATIVPNAILAEQRLPVWRRYTVVTGATITGLPVAGQRQPLALTFDERGHVIEIAIAPAPAQVAPPVAHVLEFTAPAGPLPGILTLELERLAPGLGFPNQQVNVPGAPIVADTLVVGSHERGATGTVARQWFARDDLDAASATDAAVAVDHALGTLSFGTGVRGRLVPQGAAITASYEMTHGAGGNVGPARAWTIPDEPVNRALGGAAFATLATMSLANAQGALLGTDAEDVGDALERAAAFFWSHERLLELADSARKETLDQIEPPRVLALEAPQRATTTLDYERLTRDVAGTRVARARAFATLDPRIPCYAAPGTVTVVVVPYLPSDRPSPSRGLITAVRRYLERRRILTTRLVVVGPSYVEVRVTAHVRALESADSGRVQQDIVRALNDFLNPLCGGPNGLGWPFGRDVYRSEILATIDGVDGVDHVLSASLSARRDGEGDESRCGNVCVPPTYLVASLPHSIEVVSA